MKIVAIKDAKAKLSGYCEEAQEQRVLITKHGKPLVLVIGVEGQDLEDVLTASNPKFWELIEERRRQPTISSAEMRRRLKKRSPRKS
jgi:prevent-host-death family protein